MRRKLTQPERQRAESFEREMAVAPEATMQRRDFLRRSAYAAGAAGAAASLPLNLLLGEVAKQRGARRRASRPAQHADRPLRRADDGEPVLRPLLRLAAGRRRSAAAHLPGPGQRQRPGRHAACLHARDRRSGRAAATPTPGTAGTTAASSSAPRARTRTPSRTASWPAATTSSRSATTTRASSGSSTRPAASSRSTTGSTAR